MDPNGLDQVKTLQKHMGGMVQMLRDLQSRVKGLEEKSLKSQTDALKEKEEFEKNILINSESVKQLDKQSKIY